MNIHWKDWCWSWSSNTLATWCEELTHWKRPWCWKRLRAGGEGDNRGWDGWMASSTQWIWVWANSRRGWRAGKAGVLQSMGHKESDTTQQLNNNKWIISNKQERTEQKWPPNLKSFISFISCTSFLVFAECCALGCLYSGTPIPSSHCLEHCWPSVVSHWQLNSYICS